MIELYGYWRSSAAYRIRIALHFKGLEARHHGIHLRRGEQRAADYRKRNPMGRVPTLVDGSETYTQSLAILEYLEECYPQPALLPSDAPGRARVRALADVVACDIHPLNNFSVLNYLEGILHIEPDERMRWYRHWIGVGFTALERLLCDDPRTGTYAHGERPTLADLCLVPQVYNARRFDCDLEGYPTIRRIDAACRALEPFRQAAPEVQPDAESAV